MPLSFDDKLANYAELAVRVGVNLQPKQRLIVRAPIEAAPLVRKLTETAYRAGSPLVEVVWSDDALTLARFRHAPRDSFELVADWPVAALEGAVARGDALLTVHASDPDLLRDQDPELVQTAQRAAQQKARTVNERIMRGDICWCVVSAPTPSLAAKVFPGAPDARGVAELWEAIFSAVRADCEDPVAAWRRHVESLTHRRDALNERRYAALVFRGPGTELRVGLPDGHRWHAGGVTSKRGLFFVPNLPTEEVFTLPHRERVDGVVRSSKPLSYAGKLIEDFELVFEAGRVTRARAAKNEATLHKLLDTDEGARRLGEVALVPQNSPVSRSGLLFYNTLFDENAASHLALGRAYRMSLEGGEAMSAEEAAAAGLNDSLTHVDFMIGSSEMNVDGVTEGGGLEPLMRAGEWVD